MSKREYRIRKNAGYSCGHCHSESVPTRKFDHDVYTYGEVWLCFLCANSTGKPDEHLTKKTMIQVLHALFEGLGTKKALT